MRVGVADEKEGKKEEEAATVSKGKNEKGEWEEERKGKKARVGVEKAAKHGGVKERVREKVKEATRCQWFHTSVLRRILEMTLQGEGRRGRREKESKRDGNTKRTMNYASL